MKTAAGVSLARRRGRYLNTGNGPTLQVMDIGHPDYFALIDPDTAWWSLVLKERLGIGAERPHPPRAVA